MGGSRMSFRGRAQRGAGTHIHRLIDGIPTVHRTGRGYGFRSRRFAAPRNDANVELCMTTAAFDFAPLFAPNLPAAAVKWTGLTRYYFIGGNNDREQIPVDALVEAANAVLRREGPTLANYGLASGPQGYLPLREFLVGKLKRDAGITCTVDDL